MLLSAGCGLVFLEALGWMPCGIGLWDFYFCLLEFSILELGLFWAGNYGLLGGLLASLLWGPVRWSDFDLLTAAGY